jgi:hypothetical protein
MDDNLVGYLLNALDPQTQRDVEAYLKTDPQAQQRLELLRRALEPLAADREEIEPPAGLVYRTLGAIAEYRCRPLPQAPAPRPRMAFSRSRWWTRADVLVAAGIFLTVFGVGVPKLKEIRDTRDRVACSDNLRGLHAALVDYSLKHDGKFPNVAEQPWPRNVAGMVVPLIDDPDANPQRLLHVRCPATRRPPPVRRSLKQLQAMSAAEFNADVAEHLLGCYAYSLGHRDAAGKIHGPRRADNQYEPIMADRPPHDRTAGNSLNHGGRGQNVLYIGGSVQFHPLPTIEDDHIYLNQGSPGRVAAGIHPRDIVLGSSGDRPNPDE